jgi:hypothetical protein
VSFYPAPVPRPETVVYREVSFSLAAFDRLKHWQRHMARREGRHLTNGETLDRLILALPAPDAPDTRKRRE